MFGVSCNSQKVFLQYCSSIRFYGHPHPHACTITQLHSLDSHADCDDGNFSVFTSVLTTPLAQWCVLFLNNKKQLKQFPVFIQTSWNYSQFLSIQVETIPSFCPNQLKPFLAFIKTSWNNSQFVSKPVEIIPSFCPYKLKQFPVFIQTSWNNSQFSSQPVETIPSFYPYLFPLHSQSQPLTCKLTFFFKQLLQYMEILK